MSAKCIRIKLSDDLMDEQNSTLYLLRRAFEKKAHRREVSCMVSIEMPNGHALNLQLKVISIPENRE